MERLALVDAEKYWQSGGSLSLKSLLEVLAKREGAVNRSFVVQAESMVRRSQVVLTSEQGYLYAIMREMDIEEKGLSDQCLLAEILLWTEEPELDSFKEAYPNIF